MAAGAEEGGVLLRDPEGTNGEAAAHAFGPRDGIGGQPRSDRFKTIEIAGSAKARLDFIEEEKQVVFAGQPGQAFEKFPGHWIHPTFALDRFDQKGHRFVVEGGFDGLEIVGLEVAETRQEWVEALADLGLSGGGHGADGAAVERLVEGDDFVSSGRLAEASGQLDQSVVGLGSGVGKEDFTGAGEDFFHDELREVGLTGNVVEVGAVHQGVALPGDGSGESRVAVAQRAGRNARAEIEVFPTRVIPHAGAFSSDHGEGKAAVGLEDIMLGFFDAGHGFVVRVDSVVGTALEVRE